MPFRINDLVLIRKAEDVGPSLWMAYYGPYLVRDMDDEAVQVENVKSGVLLTVKFPYSRVSAYRDESHFPGHYVVQRYQAEVQCPFKYRKKADV